MPAIHHTVFSVAHILSLGLLVTPLIFSAHVIAKPVPVPMPFVVSKHYGGSSDAMPRSVNGKHSSHLNATQGDRPHAFYPVANNHTVSESRRDFDNDPLLNNINILNTFYDKANQNAGNLQTYASQSSGGGNVDSTYSQQCGSELQAYKTNMLGFQSIFAQLGADKGLANYDRTNDLETLLKNAVNLNKNALKSVSTMIDEIPTVGPLLGPIVYEIKCILDDLLDATENLSDALINALQPLLRSVIAGYATAACRSGVVVAGLCI
ncbi:hypothetical protein EVG20_g2632 [Dentipellis fragilis]|uniref:Uncharacterized protein n=1 Tax=Dentipellis fragilis TaxID=205917 RepID=A0A4Y9Z7C9_9AGAM|nr:hypothetical protein EVG20_g2632 [Dentipellis fragilis]